MSYKKVSDWVQGALPGFGCLVSVASACRTLMRWDKRGKWNGAIGYEEWLWFHAPLNGGGK